MQGCLALVLLISSISFGAEVPGTWYDQDKLNMGDQLYFQDVNDNDVHDPWEIVSSSWVTLWPHREDLSCWMASAANMVRYRFGVDRYYSYAFGEGITGTFTAPLAEPETGTYTFDDGGLTHWCLQNDGRAWAIMAQGSSKFSWVDPADYIEACIDAGSPVSIGIWAGTDYYNNGSGHALTVYAIDTLAHTMRVADSDKDQDGDDFTWYSYATVGQNLTLDYPDKQNVQYICSFDDVGWWTGGTGAWENRYNWASQHAPTASQDVYLTQSNVGTVTLDTQASVKSLTLSSSASLALESGANLTITEVCNNSGVITHADGAMLQLSCASTLNNLAGAVYDVQGDGTIIDSGYGTINNAGIFRKSAGSGQATIGPYVEFNNTGTVEVDSGTLAIWRGSSTDEHYEFANGGRLKASFTWQGLNTANGNGVLDAGGCVASGTTATFGDFTNGATLEIGGYDGYFNIVAGAWLILNMTG